MTNFAAAIEEAARKAEAEGSVFAGKFLQYSRLKAIIDKDAQTSMLNVRIPSKRQTSMSIPSDPVAYGFNEAFEAAVRSLHSFNTAARKCLTSCVTRKCFPQSLKDTCPYFRHPRAFCELSRPLRQFSCTAFELSDVWSVGCHDISDNGRKDEEF
jgi:hypothetical protein